MEGISRPGIRCWFLALGVLVVAGMAGTGSAAAQTRSGSGTDSYEPTRVSAFEMIFEQYYPGVPCKDAPTVLNENGITCRYSIMEMPTRYPKRWRVKGKGYDRYTPTDRLITPPTLSDARKLLALSGLEMMDIMEYEELVAAGDRERLMALLIRYIDPKMDKYNKMAVEGYEPRSCLNLAGDHVYRLDIEEGTLDDILNSEKLFHAGRYEKYRDKLMKYLPDYPQLSELHVGIGNSYFAEGDLDRARQWYRKGASANPLNPMLGYSMAFCFLAAGDGPRAIEALIGSVMTCRTNMLAWVALDCLLSGQGGRVIDRRFVSRTYSLWGRGEIIVDKSVEPRLVESWLYYAAADIAINNQRSELQGFFDTWDIEEFEFYKIAHLLGMYLIQRQETGGAYDPYLDSLETIYEKGYLKQFVLYDMIAPYTRYHLTSILPEEEKRKLREYIDQFVAWH